MISSQFKSKLSRIAGFGLSAVALLSIAASAQAAEVELLLSSHETYVGMPIVAEVRVQNAGQTSDPKFPSIDGVKIVAAGKATQSSNVVIINGRTIRNDQTVGYRFQLTPNQAGKFTIPAIEVEADGQHFKTEPVEFVATKSETGDLMFVEVVGQRKEVFVGEPINLTLKIWLKPYRDRQYQLSADGMWGLIAADRSEWGAFRSALEEMAKQRTEVHGHEVLRADADGVEHSYYLYEIEHVIYPQSAGMLNPGDIRIVDRYPTGLESDFFGNPSLAGLRPLVGEAKVEPITVKPVPTAGMPADYRGAIGRYDMAVQAAPTKVKVGDQITLRIEVAGGSRLDLLQAPPLSQLPQLTRDFKVTEEPLAGVVNGGVKTFLATLRPLRTEVKEIPAIPFSSFDPQTEQFVTTQSDPIPIEVGPADELALSKIISANGPGKTAADGSDSPEAVNSLLWQFRGAQVLSSSLPPSDAAIWVLLAAPPLALLGLLLVRRSHQGVLDSSLWRRWQARRMAAHRLNHADSSEAVARAAFSYVADRFGLNAAPLTRRELVDELHHRGLPDEAVRQWDQLLSQCENAKYAGGAVSPPQELARQAESCIAKIDRYRCPKGDTQCSA